MPKNEYTDINAKLESIISSIILYF